MSTQQVATASQSRTQRRLGTYLLVIAPLILALTLATLIASAIPASASSTLSLGAGAGLATVSSPTSYTSYCKAPSSPYSAASTDIKALLTAANKERARIGARSMIWSTTLASAAQSWSKTMASRDNATAAHYDALRHNPNRPGAENVAVSYSSAGLSKSKALGKAHANWMRSYGHCLNIMNPAYRTMGAGTARTSDGTTWYTTENFR